jgi:hypothetical protein
MPSGGGDDPASEERRRAAELISEALVASGALSPPTNHATTTIPVEQASIAFGLLQNAVFQLDGIKLKSKQRTSPTAAAAALACAAVAAVADEPSAPKTLSALPACLKRAVDLKVARFHERVVRPVLQQISNQRGGATAIEQARLVARHAVAALLEPAPAASPPRGNPGVSGLRAPKLPDLAAHPFERYLTCSLGDRRARRDKVSELAVATTALAACLAVGREAAAQAGVDAADVKPFYCEGGDSCDSESDPLLSLLGARLAVSEKRVWVVLGRPSDDGEEKQGAGGGDGGDDDKAAAEGNSRLSSLLEPMSGGAAGDDDKATERPAAAKPRGRVKREREEENGQQQHAGAAAPSSSSSSSPLASRLLRQPNADPAAVATILSTLPPRVDPANARAEDLHPILLDRPETLAAFDPLDANASLLPPEDLHPGWLHAAPCHRLLHLPTDGTSPLVPPPPAFALIRAGGVVSLAQMPGLMAAWLAPEELGRHGLSDAMRAAQLRLFSLLAPPGMLLPFAAAAPPLDPLLAADGSSAAAPPPPLRPYPFPLTLLHWARALEQQELLALERANDDHHGDPARVRAALELACGRPAAAASSSSPLPLTSSDLYALALDASNGRYWHPAAGPLLGRAQRARAALCGGESCGAYLTFAIKQGNPPWERATPEQRQEAATLALPLAETLIADALAAVRPAMVVLKAYSGGGGLPPSPEAAELSNRCDPLAHEAAAAVRALVDLISGYRHLQFEGQGGVHAAWRVLEEAQQERRKERARLRAERLPPQEQAAALASTAAAAPPQNTTAPRRRRQLCRHCLRPVDADSDDSGQLSSDDRPEPDAPQPTLFPLPGHERRALNRAPRYSLAPNCAPHYPMYGPQPPKLGLERAAWLIPVLLLADAALGFWECAGPLESSGRGDDATVDALIDAFKLFSPEAAYAAVDAARPHLKCGHRVARAGRALEIVSEGRDWGERQEASHLARRMLNLKSRVPGVFCDTVPPRGQRLPVTKRARTGGWYSRKYQEEEEDGPQSSGGGFAPPVAGMMAEDSG